jgi:hypothetical protein
VPILISPVLLDHDVVPGTIVKDTEMAARQAAGTAAS